MLVHQMLRLAQPHLAAAFGELTLFHTLFKPGLVPSPSPAPGHLRLSVQPWRPLLPRSCPSSPSPAPPPWRP